MPNKWEELVRAELLKEVEERIAANARAAFGDIALSKRNKLGITIGKLLRNVNLDDGDALLELLDKFQSETEEFSKKYNIDISEK